MFKRADANASALLNMYIRMVVIRVPVPKAVRQGKGWYWYYAPFYSINFRVIPLNVLFFVSCSYQTAQVYFTTKEVFLFTSSI